VGTGKVKGQEEAVAIIVILFKYYDEAFAGRPAWAFLMLKRGGG
jgi:hypothetical protein